VSISSRATAVAAAFAYTLFGALGLSEAVLCVGAEGHVALEPAVNGCCQDQPATAHEPPPLSRLDRPYSDEAQHCGDCVDIPLSISNLDQGPPEPSSAASSPLPALAVTTMRGVGLSSRLLSSPPRAARAPPPPRARQLGVVMIC
jgi:hypothetical protein